MPQVAKVIAISPRKTCRTRLFFWTKSNMKGRDFSTRMMKLLAALASVSLAACARQPALQDHPLTGKVWDPHGAAFVSNAQRFERAARDRHVLLGWTPDTHAG